MGLCWALRQKFWGELRLEGRCPKLEHSTNKGLGLDSGGKAGAVRFPNGPRSAREQRSGRLELAEALEGAPGSLSEVAERDPPQLQEEQYPKGHP